MPKPLKERYDEVKKRRRPALAGAAADG